jgi:hypothetical protein
MKKIISAALLLLASTAFTACYANTTVIHTNNYVAPAVVVHPKPVVVVKPAPVVVVHPKPVVVVKPAPIIETKPTVIVR